MRSHEVEQRQGMKLFSIEHSRAVYWADFALYASAVSVFSVLLRVASPRGEWRVSAGLVALGLAGWTIIEYGLHRSVLHGVAPFRHWHAQQHQRPTALISAPTLLSATLVAAGALSRRCGGVGCGTPRHSRSGCWQATCAVSRASVCQRTYAAPVRVHDGDARTEGPVAARPPSTEPAHEPH